MPTRDSDPISQARTRGPRRRTVGLLLDHFGCNAGSYQGALRDAFELACADRGYDVVMAIGRALESPSPSAQACNSVYQLMGPDVVDGLVLIAGGLSTFGGAGALERLCRRYRGMPLCSFGVDVVGIPSVVADNGQGMDELVEHIVGHHACRRVAFIGGPENNPDAMLRLESYHRVLSRHGIELAPTLVERGTFTVGSGELAMRRLLERGQPIDAVIAANDGMALGAIEVLKEHGIRVPRDLLVTGVDDSEMGRLAEPSLTSIRQPLEAMADAALTLLERQLAGESVPARTRVGLEVLARASCGCVPGRALRPSQPASAPHGSQPFPRATRRPGSQARRASLAGGDAAQILPMLEEHVARAPLGREVAFVHELLEDLYEVDSELREREGATSAVHQTLQPAFDYLRATQLRFHVQRARQIEEYFHKIAYLGELLAVALDRDMLRELLEKHLGYLGLRSVSVLLYPEEEAAGELTPFLSWAAEPGARVDVDPARGRLLPTPPPGAEPRRFIYLPLVSDEKTWGFLAIEPGPKIVDHERLATSISIPLNNILLHKELVTKTALHERSLQERQATAERLKSLGVLAGGVAHDLNNVLGPLLALPDVMLKELDRLALDSAAAGELRADLFAMRAATLRASRTIKDLVTLSRKRRAVRSPVDLNRVVADCVLGAESPYAREGLPPRVALHAEALMLEGSEPHLARAVVNLVQNAVEACGGTTGVSVSTRRITTVAARTGYETIEPGDYAELRVSDRGPGIRREILGRIFEPYFSQKPLSESSGSGLGLALVHGIVKEHEGFIDVESSEEEGTTFTLYLPLTRAARRESVPPLAATGGNASVLVIDDDPLQLRTARRVLTNLGYPTTTLSSGRAALDLLERASASAAKNDPSPYDLIIADVALGEDKDGLQVCERIRELFPRQRLLIASGHASPERGAAAAFTIAWLAKPYSADELGRAVAQALALESPASTLSEESEDAAQR